VLPGAAVCQAAETRVVPVSPRVYLIENLGESGNVAFLVTEDGVLVVDSGALPVHGRTIVEKVRSVTDRPIRYVVLTHYHDDHTFGLQSFPAEALVIAAQNLPRNQKRDQEAITAALERLPAQIAELRASLQQMGAEASEARVQQEEKLKSREARLALFRELRLVPPGLLFDGRLTLRLGGETVEIVFPGPAHTDDNAWVYFAGQKVLHMGDMVFQRCHPYIDWRAGSNTANWIAQLKVAEGLAVEKVIPGHGAVVGPEVLAEQARYLSELRVAVKGEIDKGTPLEEIKTSLPMGAYTSWGFDDMWPFAIEAVYRELGGLAAKD